MTALYESCPFCGNVKELAMVNDTGWTKCNGCGSEWKEGSGSNYRMTQLFKLVEALRPFATTAYKRVLDSIQRHIDVGFMPMGDEASTGWGIKVRHIKAAKACFDELGIQ